MKFLFSIALSVVRTCYDAVLGSKQFRDLTDFDCAVNVLHNII